jgi:hypothetical protein
MSGPLCLTGGHCRVLTACAWQAAGIAGVADRCGLDVRWQRWPETLRALPALADTLPVVVVGVLPDEAGLLAQALLTLGRLLCQQRLAMTGRPVRVVLLTPLPARWVLHTLARLCGPRVAGWRLIVLPPTVSPVRLQVAMVAGPAGCPPSHGERLREGIGAQALEVLDRTFRRRQSLSRQAWETGMTLDGVWDALRAALAALGESALRGGWHWRAGRAWLPGYPPLHTRLLRPADAVRYARRGMGVPFVARAPLAADVRQPTVVPGGEGWGQHDPVPGQGVPGEPCGPLLATERSR